MYVVACLLLCLLFLFWCSEANFSFFLFLLSSFFFLLLSSSLLLLSSSLLLLSSRFFLSFFLSSCCCNIGPSMVANAMNAGKDEERHEPPVLQKRSSNASLRGSQVSQVISVLPLCSSANCLRFGCAGWFGASRVNAQPELNCSEPARHCDTPAAGQEAIVAG